MRLFNRIYVIICICVMCMSHVIYLSNQSALILSMATHSLLHLSTFLLSLHVPFKLSFPSLFFFLPHFYSFVHPLFCVYSCFNATLSRHLSFPLLSFAFISFPLLSFFLIVRTSSFSLIQYSFTFFDSYFLFLLCSRLSLLFF